MSESYSSSSDTEDEVIEIGDESHDEPTSKRFFRPSGRTSGSTSATGRHSKKRKKISWVFDQFYEDDDITGRITAVTTNSGGEMPPAMRHVAAKLNEEFDAKLESDWHVRCVCHIINRAVKDCETIVKLVVEKIRSLLKMICVSAVLRVAFREIQVLLGRRNIVDVPGLDVETRWNSMFEMIDNCFLVKDVFESMCNKEDFTAALGGLQLSQTDWREIKAVVNFLRPASELTTTASGSSYVTLSIQPLIYESLKTHCLSTISDTLEYGFTVPAAKRAAEAMLSKLEKYKENMNSPLCLLASDLDPSVPVPDIDIQELKFCIRQILIVRYGYQQQQNVEIPQRLGLLAAAKLVRAGSCVERGQIDEVDDFFELTKRTDTSYDNVLEWWSTSNKRFPLLSRLARDTFMVMGSSVPLESAFSDSGSFVTSRRSSLSDENISKMMKLRSWNRLLKVLNK
ncbi:hypothetical protein AXG93_4773s1100 [Marchantia polymorpha subsp. ruderalis]|uniref:HAT C-terminal dimerisation domain-containing protein n=1 Tax=Marchantia polymorpha subsp. ruderalis TaxID=1480154 RepID=A0A176WJ30_MARPO|nr:hypothetical protein AXG93_4773s1100 [Marchantia polymorpha subsp. ruderalis]